MIIFFFYDGFRVEAYYNERHQHVRIIDNQQDKKKQMHSKKVENFFKENPDKLLDLLDEKIIRIK